MINHDYIINNSFLQTFVHRRCTVNEKKELVLELRRVKRHLCEITKILQGIYISSGLHKKPKILHPEDLDECDQEIENYRNLLDDSGKLMLGMKSNISRLVMMLERERSDVVPLKVCLDSEEAHGLYHNAASMAAREKVG
ncbi:MAG: hypothetical protein GF349_03030 [Candidatus Magasanikbacteria bacterium]|nr:hypothetical protein [Candidatus Magasanikbacteria bacterium]